MQNKKESDWAPFLFCSTWNIADCSTWNNRIVRLNTLYRPKKTSKTLMSAGDTPGMRDASPIVLGRIFVSF